MFPKETDTHSSKKQDVTDLELSRADSVHVAAIGLRDETRGLGLRRKCDEPCGREQTLASWTLASWFRCNHQGGQISWKLI